MGREQALFFLRGIGHEGSGVFPDAGEGRRDQSGEVLSCGCGELGVDLAALAVAVAIEFKAKAGWSDVEDVDFAIGGEVEEVLDQSQVK